MKATLDRYQEARRLVLAAMLALAAGALLFVRSRWDTATHETIETVGLGLIVLGVVGRLWCTLYIGGRKSEMIVEVGPYSITRNPLYVFSSIAAAGVGAQSGSMSVAFMTMLGCVAAFLIVIRREEKYLHGIFGASYEAYLGRVPRFVPDFSIYRDHAELSIRTRRLYATLFDGLVFFAALPVLEAIEWMQNAKVLSILVRMP